MTAVSGCARRELEPYELRITALLSQRHVVSRWIKLLQCHDDVSRVRSTPETLRQVTPVNRRMAWATSRITRREWRLKVDMQVLGANGETLDPPPRRHVQCIRLESPWNIDATAWV